ncbi:hypothetical protein M8C21_016472, partial [Ambrosia artemisiifolia]
WRWLSSFIQFIRFINDPISTLFLSVVLKFLYPINEVPSLVFVRIFFQERKKQATKEVDEAIVLAKLVYCEFASGVICNRLIYVELFAMFRNHQHGRWQAWIGRVAGIQGSLLGHCL